MSRRCRRDEAAAEAARIVEQTASAVNPLEARLAEQRAVEAVIEELRGAD